MNLHACTADCHNSRLPCRHRSSSIYCLRVRNFNNIEARANRETDIACEDQRAIVESAHTAFKILHANYLREREEVYRAILADLEREENGQA